ncbi:acetyl ornithine aminotransferase family protein [Hyperthermus butylicus]|uniref:Ornithine aminotransferase n=1 Tax=Hyperthermus butylicus (strain DSM 5456 / JCM 9403 / PLM1-5) TaxID=415426 RepID=A2BL63_HYPBU|nr:acetyl ornithine aminotransferase family protein [Hyperthermus butylicus]ABM80724.1 4-aminobutyrate aminotransferase [Hyperthermus butylicus DSM 5456]
MTSDKPVKPRIIVEPPGPKAREVIEKDQKLLMQSFARWYPLVVERAEDYLVWDVDGNMYIDLNAGIAVLNVGSSNPDVVKAAIEQLKKFTHYSLTDFYYEVAVRLAEKLVEIAPVEKPAKVFFTNSGAESIEASIKVSRYSTRRQYLIAFLGAFHGRTMGAVSLTASKPVQRKWFSPLLPSVIHVPYPYPYRCPFRAETPEECGEAIIGYIEEWIFGKMVDPAEVAAFIFEPIQGEGGYVVPPDNFFSKLEKLARQHGILLVSDEVQTGFCRTGRWFAIEHWGVKPDVVATAKAIAGGLPLGAVIGSEKVMTIEPGGHATTFGGNPVSAAAAIAVIDYMKRERLCERAARLGEKVLKRLNEAKEEIELIGDVRGKGLMIGVELVRDRRTKEPARKELAELLSRLFKKGYLFIAAGISVVRIAPPLTIAEEALDNAIEALIEELKRIDLERHRTS